jgi:hypothetical protein
MEIIQDFAQHPSTNGKCLKFDIYKGRQVAKAEAESVAPSMYTDGSRRNGMVGITVV